MRRILGRLNVRALLVFTLVSAFLLVKEGAYAQVTDQGTIKVTVTDPSKALLPDTHLKLIDKGTNLTREGTTQRTGVFTFQGLAPAEYRLVVDHDGFEQKTYETVVVQAGVTTPVDSVMTIGSEKQQIDVSAVSVPVIETSSNTLSTSVDLNEVQNLPVQGRSLLSLQTLTPGYSSATGTGTGTFNGQAQASYSAGVDGVNSTNLRNDTGNGTSSSITLRTENIQEFTVQTGELDASQGGGRSASQSLFTTNRGTNRFHGTAFEDFQNAALNANTWASGVTGLKKAHLILNDFGGSVGGPVLRNKLFFFGNYSMNISPNTITNTAVVPTAAAFAGNYTYAKACPGSTTAAIITNCPVSLNTVNVLTFARNGGQDPNVNAGTQLNHDLIATTLPYAQLTQSTTQYNTITETWLTPRKTTNYYPTARLDYALTSKLNWSLSGNMSKSVGIGNYPGFYPGPYFQQKYTGSTGASYVLSTGLDWTIKPTILNQLKVGYLYTNSFFSPEALAYCLTCQGTQSQGFGLSNTNINYTGIGQFYPYITFSDDVSWQKGAHTIKFGGNGWRQQDHYYNGRLGFNNINLGMGSQDPAYAPIISQTPGFNNSKTSFDPNTPSNLSGAEGDLAGLYAYLNGRISSINASDAVNAAKTGYAPGGYNLDELARGGGIYLMDSWRALPGLTLNYGLRWDFIGDQHDLKSGYTGPDSVNLFGSSGYMNYFQPGANSGPATPIFVAKSHAYHANLVLPQPQIGLAWNPSGSSDSLIGRIFGQGKSVIRASFTLKNYTEGGQNFWQNASNSGFNFFNNGSLAANVTTGPQYYAYGQYHLAPPGGSFKPGDDPMKACPDPIHTCVLEATNGSLPPLNFSPPVYSTTLTQASLFFGNSGNLAINPYIKEPYTQSWTLGFQRQLTHSSAVEIRYVGNHTVHDWLNLNYNEVNGLNNGFLQDFKAAQQNLAINAAAGSSNDFSNHGSGPAMPILTAAFAGTNVSQFKNSTYVNYLNYGALGSLASAVATNETYFCNVVGKQFAPCSAVAAAPAASAYPANLFKANPYMESTGASYLDSVGSSNYNGLQVEFRQKVSHGLDLNANYTYAKSLGFAQQGSTGSSPATFFTLHNRQLNYVPSAYDIRNTFKMSSTYALPFGKGKAFLNHNKLENYTIGGWTVGGIFIYQSGAPSLLTGGLSSTVNSASDGGVTFLPGHSAREIQSQIHITPAAAGNAYVNFVPSTLQGVTAANNSILVPNTTAGTIGNLNYLYGPKWNNLSMALTKDFPVFERVHMNLQGEFLNLPNHPAWGLGNTTVNSSTFGTTGSLLRGARAIELRANITF